MAWGFYGRSRELVDLKKILERGRFFFARITGRRRIGKTTLVQHALSQVGRVRVFYVQVPDSAPAGVLSAVGDAMDTFEIPAERFPRPESLLELAHTVESLIRHGYVVALDEFRYFSRKHLSEFTSFLQSAVDALAADADGVSGGLIVLGSLHAELIALLEDRQAPLFNRTTDELELGHLDIASIVAVLDAHADRAPERLLFLWNLFEGVPKFYRDAYEQRLLDKGREDSLERMFFRSSAPLRTEAEHWFLSELRGRYDVILKYVARHPGCTHGEVEAHVREVSPSTAEQVGGYLKILIERYQMIERRQPIFAKSTSRRCRYYLRDNFLRSWLAALHGPVSAINFRPQPLLVAQANERLADVEGHGLERLSAQLYEERSRLGIGDFALTHRIEGYWDRKDIEIDLVALDEENRLIRFGSCKRNPDRLPGDVPRLKRHVESFLSVHTSYRQWSVEFAAIAPSIPPSIRGRLQSLNVIPQDLTDLTAEL